jgi:type IV fimbrial biogenesis protein FimT
MRQLTPAAAARPQRGLTLIELMITLTVALIIALVGAPFFGDYVANSRLREGGNTLFGEAMFAQSEAIKRNAQVRLTIDGSTLQTLDLSAGEPGVELRRTTIAAGVAPAASASATFDSDGRPTPFGTAVAVNLGMSSISCSDTYRCPGLRIDAGGAIRLCGNHLSSCP